MEQDERQTNDAIQRPRTGIRRRDFLAFGSVLAVAPWVERAAAAATLAKAVAGPSARPVSVGYLEGSAGIQNLRHLAPDFNFLTVYRQGDALVEGRRVVPADSLPAGDSSLAGVPVRISIRGLYPSMPPISPPPPAASALPLAIDLDVYVPSVELSQGAGFLYHAWSYRRLPAVDLSAPLSFLISPDWYSDFAVVLRVRRANAGAATPPRLSRAAFTLGADAGRPRLQSGAYLLAVNPGSWDKPVELPGSGAAGQPGRLSILMTVAPEGIAAGSSAR